MTETAVAPPHDLDAEESVLGAMLLSPAAIDAVRGVVDPGDFYRESHAKIYRAALSLHQLGQPVDGITVADRLHELGQLEDVGGKTRIHEIAALVPAAGNAAHWAGIVARHARRRALAHLGEQLVRAAHDAADPDDVRAKALEQLEATVAPAAAAPPVVLTLDAFVNEHEETAEALIGDRHDAPLPAGGLAIIGGEGGASKTTLTIDAIAHLSSGTTWLGYPVERPIRVLIIENEGPRPQFRDKLRAKTDAWTGRPWLQNVLVWTEPWAQFNFSRDTDRRHLRHITAEHQIDLVVADPLDSLGVVGAGTPEDTRTFIGWLRDCGLHNPQNPLAFWLLHHFNKTGHRSVVAQLSGAWGAHPDAIIGVELGDGQTTKLTWGKLRHATPPKDKTIILAWDIATRGFAPIDKPAEIDIDELRNNVLEYVTANPGAAQSAVEEAIAGPGKSRKSIRSALEWLTTAAGGEVLARGPGRAPNGKYFYPASPLSSPLAAPLFSEHGEHSFPTSDPEVLAAAGNRAAASTASTPHDPGSPSESAVLAAALPSRREGGYGERAADGHAEVLAAPHGEQNGSAAPIDDDEIERLAALADTNGDTPQQPAPPTTEDIIW